MKGWTHAAGSGWGINGVRGVISKSKIVIRGRYSRKSYGDTLELQEGGKTVRKRIFMWVMIKKARNKRIARLKIIREKEKQYKTHMRT